MDTHHFNSDVADRRMQAGSFDFRRIHPHLQFGTASDRYAGWIGQIYPRSFEAEIKTRRKKLADQVFEERTLPVSSVKHYFEHHYKH